MIDEAVADALATTRRRDHRARREKGVLHYIGLGLSGAILVAVVALAAVVIVIPKVTGAIPLTVLTSSMEPGLPPGTLIVVQPVDNDELGVGDVITYQIRSGEGTVITHRIVGISSSTTGQRSFILKGDNNSTPDADPVVPAQVHGRVWYAVPFVGFAASAVNGSARSWIIPLAAGLLLAYAGYSLVTGALATARKRRRRAEYAM